MPELWGDKRYNSLNYDLKKKYGKKIYRVSLNGGMTCPNRDGTLGKRGCIFCSSGGSGEFAGNALLSVSAQIEEEKKKVQKKYNGDTFIAYFQAYTNTYAPVSRLRPLFTEAITHPDICILSVATRPDCLSEEVLDLLSELNHIKPVWVELGLQTIHPDTAAYIRRGYPLCVFEDAVKHLRTRGIDVIVHTILGLPGESPGRILETIRYLNTQDIQGIKLQLLHILEGTDLACQYRREPFELFTMDEYISLLGQCICLLCPDIVIHRLTGDPPLKMLLAPDWCRHKWTVLNRIQAYLKARDLWQGKEYNHDRIDETI